MGSKWSPLFGIESLMSSADRGGVPKITVGDLEKGQQQMGKVDIKKISVKRFSLQKPALKPIRHDRQFQRDFQIHLNPLTPHRKSSEASLANDPRGSSYTRAATPKKKSSVTSHVKWDLTFHTRSVQTKWLGI
ncbi:hypothetical protein CDAR_78031 [Caerostris darwini]|uniref:Uncharacterized protein n=1 Tax=Caerostris darwini TaxID=1538125 RepID=A0AAV4RPR4_9ARAC|nr:hypothetical protein CDAR_78031 [Caerostris darwini]